MNKLYVIRWLALLDHSVIYTSSFWTEEALKDKMEKNKECWKFEMVEDNDIHQIWEAK